ncbi:bone morphogenetic protein 8A isoform X2 [Papio anubis]|uniref:bone morphogenetic protein 8A isoform X2 n=1 Tax=Papio anubis TaxID=9555 RepID=UPI0012AD6EC0|nr:bone morphogenetic protein 8A isoform X2 [Papio anubis]
MADLHSCLSPAQPSALSPPLPHLPSRQWAGSGWLVSPKMPSVMSVTSLSTRFPCRAGALFCLGSNVHLPFSLEAPRGGSLLCLISGSQDQPDREGEQWEFGVWSLGSVEHQPGAGLRLSLAAGPLSPVCSLGPSLEQTFAQKETGPARPPWVPSTLSGGWLGAVAHTSSAHSKVRAIPSASPALLCLLVERDHALGHQEPHWKEFRFDLTQIPDGEAVTAAEFRIYKVPSIHLLNRTLHVSMFQVVQEQSNRESDLFFLDLQTLRAGDEGWLVLDVTAASDRWLLKRHKDLGLRLYVETEDGHSVDPGLAGLLGQRAPRSRQPFVVTFFRASPSPIRTPRAVRPLRRRQPKKTNELPQANRLPGIFDDVHGSHGRQVCRRHELYVSFQDLGWLDWVIAPQGYSAYYCEGECSFPLDSCMNATNHAILQSLVHLMKPDAVPKACCAPTKLSATSVLYYDSSNNVILRKHRNMVVKACGCH